MSAHTIDVSKSRMIWCCGCQRSVIARLTDGAEIYPHRPDLASFPRWICDTCGNHVGTHYKTSDPTKPLGCIPTPEIAAARVSLHHHIDFLWSMEWVDRKTLYKALGAALGRPFHIGEVRTLEEVKAVRHAVNAFMEQSGMLSGVPHH